MNSTTRALLVGSVIAGPIYIIVGLIQILIRPGFDVTRHSLSLMTNGDLGWIQITNFFVTGLLTIAGAVGMRKALRGSRGGTLGSLLVGVYGLSLIGAGIFTADPANGFPPGTSTDANAISTHGILHFVSGAIGFLSLIAACFVFGRRFAALGQQGWALYSIATGVIFFASFCGIAMGSQPTSPALEFVTIAFYVAVVIAWAWVSGISARLLAGVDANA